MSQTSNQTPDDLPSRIYATIGEKLYLSEKLADFHFVFETSDSEFERVPVHKDFLITASDVFEVMFNGSWEEMDEVRVFDSPVAAFKEFLQFFYLGRVKITVANVARVMYLADKYNLVDGLSVCARFIASTLTDENVCWAYELAIRFDQDGLKKLCETLICANPTAVIASECFLECNRDVLEHILNLGSMDCTEKQLFEACIAWVKSTSNENKLTKKIIQLEMGDLMKKIRFGSMSTKEFASLIPSYGNLFSIDEYKDLIQIIGSDEYQPKIFTGDRRKRAGTTIPNKSSIIACNRLISAHCSVKPYDIKDIETTVFSCNQTLILSAFTCGSILKFVRPNYNLFEQNLPTAAEIIEQCDQSRSEVVLYSKQNISLRSSGTKITLDKPILIKPRHKYKIRMQQSPPDSCCSGGLLKSEVPIQPDITVRFHDDPVVGTDKVARGLISVLYFNVF